MKRMIKAVKWVAMLAALMFVTGCSNTLNAGSSAEHMFGPNEYGSFHADDILCQSSSGALYFVSAVR